MPSGSCGITLKRVYVDNKTSKSPANSIIQAPESWRDVKKTTEHEQVEKNTGTHHPAKLECDVNKRDLTQADIEDTVSEEEGEIKEKPSAKPSSVVSKYEDLRKRGRGSFFYEDDLSSCDQSPSRYSRYTTSTLIASSEKTSNFSSGKSYFGVTKKAGRNLRLQRRLAEKSLALQALVDGRMVVAPMRPSDMVWSRNMLKPGRVISAPQHSSAHTDCIHPEHENVSFSSHGAIYSKYRMMIIMENWGEHSTCLPLYSYQGRGLQNREHFSGEYISVRNDDDTTWEPRETPTAPLRAKKFPSWNGQFISGRTVVKLTERCTLFRRSKCSIEGYILPDDFEILWREYSELSAKKKDESIRKAWSGMSG